MVLISKKKYSNRSELLCSASLAYSVERLGSTGPFLHLDDAATWFPVARGDSSIVCNGMLWARARWPDWLTRKNQMTARHCWRYVTGRVERRHTLHSKVSRKAGVMHIAAQQPAKRGASAPPFYPSLIVPSTDRRALRLGCAGVYDGRRASALPS